MEERRIKPNNKKTKTKKYIEGIIKLRGRKGGVVYDEKLDKEVVIERRDLNTALHEDRVKVSVSTKKKGFLSGTVKEVLLRAKTDFVGTLQKDGDAYSIKPQDPKMYTQINILKGKLNGGKVGDKVLVGMLEWNDPNKIPYGKVEIVIGKAGVHETEIQAIILDKGFEIGFSKEVLASADDIKKNYPKLLKQEIGTRKDFRDALTFTIDPNDAKDFDDALSFKKLENGTFEVGIHIADPTFFIEKNSPIDKSAGEKSTSIYLVDRTIPMLPEVLSNDLCSLNPDEDKLTFSVVLNITPHGEVIKRWFGRTVIHSDKRFTYKSAQNTIDSVSLKYSDELTILNNLAKKIREKRGEKGMIEFEEDEIYFKLDKNGKPISIEKKERLETHKLIEEFMILANKEVATFMSGHDKKVKQTFVYRVHDIPDNDKIRELINLLRILRYNVPKKTQGFDVEDISTILKSVEGTPHEHLVQMATIRAMSKAIYTTKNIGHFGLSLKHYTHFTSPIRRYPDMMVHRLLSNYIEGKGVRKEEFEEYEALSRYSTQMEIAATRAERESIKYKQTEYMSDRIGKQFKGTINGLSEIGLYVRENTSLAEGLVRLRDLKNDYYTLDQKTFSVIGRNRSNKYSLGDTVTIEVVRADVEKKLIDYKIIMK